MDNNIVAFNLNQMATEAHAAWLNEYMTEIFTECVTLASRGYFEHRLQKDSRLLHDDWVKIENSFVNLGFKTFFPNAEWIVINWYNATKDSNS